ncbi:hypothetical protein CR162_00765 [Pseudoroseomonas rhizosphaerae]|uniref:Uncharacterized protein n=1 Tax=Teichococcus rhizosphaerae TaxID=1335062 RepID=A0A2C7A9Z8_9PROT|nr:hypothetical protein [Pseudoroseomonas rhizosphaerae]PHK96938.1 hypothetical protein CR162_00765 [Pseudoroseomonas rhizosphaerae]
MAFSDVMRLVGLGILALMGLLIARSNMPLITTQHIGLALFLGAIGYGLLLVKRHFDRTLP